MSSYSYNNRPVIIGVGQCVNRSNDASDIQTPLDLIEDAVQKAEEDSCAKELLQHTDTVCLVNTLSHPYDDTLPENHSYFFGGTIFAQKVHALSLLQIWKVRLYKQAFLLLIAK